MEPKQRISYLLDLATRCLSTRQTDPGTIPQHRVNNELFAELRSASLSLIAGLFEIKHPYYTEFETQVKNNTPKDVERATGILRAIQTDLK